MKKEVLQFWSTDNNTIYIDVQYESPSELFEPHLLSAPGKSPLMQADVIDLLERMLERLSLSNAKVLLRFHFNDFASFNSTQLKEIILRNLNMQRALVKQEVGKTTITSFCLAGTGCLMLLLSYLLQKEHSAQLLFDVINISGTFMIWDAASRFVIDRLALNRRAKKWKCFEVKIVFKD